MLFNIKKMFDSFYKNNKAATVAIIFIISSMLIEVMWYEIHKTTAMVAISKDISIENSSKIGFIEKQMVTQDMFTRNIVKRESFNAYIKRKDDEYHNQMEINNLVSSKIGFLEGQIVVFYNVLDSFVFTDNTKIDEDCK